MEEAIELFVKHFCGEVALEDSVYKNLRLCEDKRLLNTDTLKRLHVARQNCNDDKHECKVFDYETVCFTLVQVRDLLDIVEVDSVLS